MAVLVVARGSRYGRRSTTSGAAPSGKASTGVPQAMASIMTMPNGSFHRMGKRRAEAPASSSSLRSWDTSPR